MSIDADPPTVAPLPDETQRWRCGGCGNLTRFDVVRTATTQEFWHVDLAGVAQVEDVTTTTERIDSVVCRWCGRGEAVELVPRPDAEDR
jgi:hypothetical protein